MTSIKIENDLTEVETNGDSTKWLSIPMTGFHVFPYLTGFELAGEIWAMEFSIFPGRYGDLLNASLLKQDGSSYTPVYDWTMKSTVQITIDNSIRIMGIDISPDFRDNYTTNKVFGRYEVIVSEVVT